MFLTVLAGSLALGAGLLAAAGYSEGTLVAARTAALTIGWLLLLATLIGVQGVRRGRLAELGTTAVVFFSGVGVLYLSYFHWGELAPQAAIRLVAADVLPELETEMDLIAAEPLAASATFASPPAVASVAVPAAASVAVPAVASVAVPAAAKEPPSPRREVVDPCSSLGGLEALQCKRCGDKRGVAWLLCQERARLEYCEGRSAGEALCPSAIPAATTEHVPPG
jgi:hypothetical protein